MKQGSNGKWYAKICCADRREQDQYGNTHTLYMSQTAEQRNAQTPKHYVGSAKAVVTQQAPVTPQQAYQPATQSYAPAPQQTPPAYYPPKPTQQHAQAQATPNIPNNLPF